MTHALTIAAAALLAFGDPNGITTTNSPVTLPTPDRTTLTRRALNTPAAELRLGDRAPNFSYQASDGSWRRLDAILAQGPVLLLLGADESSLRAIAREREGLMDLGVIPVVVVEYRSRAAQAMVQRLNLGFTVLADPQGIIASQFSATNPMTGRQLPTWFVLDRKSRVKAIGKRGLPPAGYAGLAAKALGIPAAGAVVPSSR